MLSIGLFAGYQAWRGNFHTLVAGEAYRSSQLSPQDLTYYTKRYGIRSIVNLRGENDGRAWYDEEKRIAQTQGIAMIDFRMSSKRVLSDPEAQALIAVMRDAPKPMLLHCNGGANRTGLASALYLAAIKKSPEWVAEWQLSPFFGNFPRWLGSRSRMGESFEQLEPALGYSNS